MRPEAAIVGCDRRSQHLWSHSNPYSRPEAATVPCARRAQDSLTHRLLRNMWMFPKHWLSQGVTSNEFFVLYSVAVRWGYYVLYFKLWSSKQSVLYIIYLHKIDWFGFHGIYFCKPFFYIWIDRISVNLRPVHVIRASKTPLLFV